MIRLQRVGKKKSPSYRVIVNEKARDTYAPSLEILGHYDPTQNPKVLELKADRIKYWISVGAQCSNTVHNLLLKEGIVEGDKKKSVSVTNKRQSKIDEKKAAEKDAQKEAEAAAAEPVVEETPVEESASEEVVEAPAEEVKEEVGEASAPEQESQSEPEKVEEEKEQEAPAEAEAEKSEEAAETTEEKSE